jgi:hypothetical protein
LAGDCIEIVINLPPSVLLEELVPNNYPFVFSLAPGYELPQICTFIFSEVRRTHMIAAGKAVAGKTVKVTIFL